MDSAIFLRDAIEASAYRKCIELAKINSTKWNELILEFLYLYKKMIPLEFKMFTIEANVRTLEDIIQCFNWFYRHYEVMNKKYEVFIASIFTIFTRQNKRSCFCRY